MSMRGVKRFLVSFESDWEEAAKLERISRATIEVTEKLRRDNGIVFACEKEARKSRV